MQKTTFKIATKFERIKPIEFTEVEGLVCGLSRTKLFSSCFGRV